MITYNTVPLKSTLLPGVYQASLYVNTRSGVQIEQIRVNDEIVLDSIAGDWVIDKADIPSSRAFGIAWPALVVKAFVEYSNNHPGGKFIKVAGRSEVGRLRWTQTTKKGWPVMVPGYKPAYALFALTGLRTVTVNRDNVSAQRLKAMSLSYSIAAVVETITLDDIKNARGYNPSTRIFTSNGIYIRIRDDNQARVDVWGKGFGSIGVTWVCTHAYALMPTSPDGMFVFRNPWGRNLMWPDITRPPVMSQDADVRMPYAAFKMLAQSVTYVER
jgi:hypothetical protein